MTNEDKIRVQKLLTRAGDTGLKFNGLFVAAIRAVWSKICLVGSCLVYGPIMFLAGLMGKEK